MGWGRWLVYSINILTLLLSTFFFGITLWAKVEDITGKTGMTAALNFDLIYVLLIIEFVIMAISLVGALGVLREIGGLIKVYSTILLLFIILKLVGVILIIAFNGKINSLFEELIVNQVTRYDQDISAQNLVDLIQLTFSCCGGETLIDYNKTQIFNCQNPTSALACGVPFSCCTKSVQAWDCGKDAQRNPLNVPEYIHSQGCSPTILDFFRVNVIILGVTLGVIIILEIVCVAICRRLRVSIDRFKYQYEKKRSLIARM